MTRLSFHKVIETICTILVIVAMGSGVANAQALSRIQGKVKDAKTGEPLPGVDVFVVGTDLGAVTDLNGNYFIINVPVGTYEVKAAMVGYAPMLVKNVFVSLNRVATVDFSLKSSQITTNEVVVTASRNQLHQEVSSTEMIATAHQMTSVAGVRQISSYISKLPGVSTTTNGFVTIRGGTADQTGTIVNGLNYDNEAVGNAETSIPLSAIQQVSVMQGGYNAEYGNFRSGLIDITTKTGTNNGYHGTFDISADNSHMRRFGQSLYNPLNAFLSPYLDPSVAFTGNLNTSTNPYEQNPEQFPGWIQEAKTFNQGKPLAQQASPLEMYLWSSWMTMTVPDYSGLQSEIAKDPTILGNMTVAQADSMLNATKKAFQQHANHEGGSDYNLDGGFGGPIPLVGKALGNATFYLSNNTKKSNYIEPVSLSADWQSTSMLTMKSTPSNNITVTLNGLWKREIGVSPIRPASGDEPNVDGRGGFMQSDNLSWVFGEAGLTGDNYNYLYDPPYFPILDETTVMTGLNFNQVISPKTYYSVTMGRLYIGDYSPTGDNGDTTMITQVGPIKLDMSPYSKLQFAPRHSVDGFVYPNYDAPPGMSIYRFEGKEGNLHDNAKTYEYQFKFDLSSQIGDHNFFKTGFHFNDIIMDHNFWEEWNSNAYNTYEFNYHRTPSQSAFYAQDQINYQGIVANLGVRFDYYFGGGGLWPSEPFVPVFQPHLPSQNPDSTLYAFLNTGQSYIWSVWEQYNQTHPGFLQKIKNFLTVSPRIGVSFPITTQSKFYFNYGQFRSNPPYFSMYQYVYRYTKNGLYQMSNPNLAPPLTTSYELGVDYEVAPATLLRVSGYYKDITGQEGTVYYQTIASSLGLNYKSYANNQYQSVEGLEVYLSKEDNSWWNGWIDFNYDLSRTGNTGVETYYDIPITDGSNLYQNNENPTLPRPHVNANVSFRSPAHWGPQIAGLDIFGRWDLSFFGTWEAGDYFTWNPLGNLYTVDNMQWPSYYNLDMKLTKTFKVAGLDVAAYLNVTNVLDLKINEMGNLYDFSSDLAGSPAAGQPGYTMNNSNEAIYLASLHLPMYNSPAYDQLRASYPGLFIPGHDQVGDLKSASKPYIINPDYADLFAYAQPRDIWFGIKVNF